MVPGNNLKLMVSHPASAAYEKKPWDCGDMWNKINSHLEKSNQEKIQW